MINYELLAFQLATDFRNQKRAVGNWKVFSLKNIKASKYWPYLLETVVKYSERPEWDMYAFVASNLYNNPNIVPAQLPTENSWKVFMEYKHRYEKTNDVEEVIEKTLLGFISVRDYCKSHKKEFSVETFIEDKYNNYKIENEIIPLHFFAFSKAFHEKYYTEKYHLIKQKRMVVNANSKPLVNKLKEILKEDFI